MNPPPSPPLHCARMHVHIGLRLFLKFRPPVLQSSSTPLCRGAAHDPQAWRSKAEAGADHLGLLQLRGLWSPPALISLPGI